MGLEDAAKKFADRAEKMYESAKLSEPPSLPGVRPEMAAASACLCAELRNNIEASGDRSAAMAAEMTARIFEGGQAEK